jgi:hypothetical protein
VAISRPPSATAGVRSVDFFLKKDARAGRIDVFKK